MSYVESNLLPEEQIIHTAKVHWCVFIPGALFLVIGILQLAALHRVRSEVPAVINLPLWIAIALLIRAQLIRMTSELAVTSRRVIAKSGVIRHHCIEINLSKVESFEVVQGLLGRMLGYGTINVNGTGGMRTPMKKIERAVEFRRNAVAVVHAAQSMGTMQSRVA